MTRDFFAFLTFTAVVMVHHCIAACPPPPTGPKFKWLDAFTVKVSWQKPNGLPDGEVQYGYRLKNGERMDEKRTPLTHFEATLYTEPSRSNNWTYIIWVIGSKSCQSLNRSLPITVATSRPRAKVEDIKCLISPPNMSCSWVPGNHQSFKLHYKTCEKSKEGRTPLKPCNRSYSNGGRSGCDLELDDADVEAAINKRICMLVETENGSSTFLVTQLVVHPPELSVREEGDELVLSCVNPQIEQLSKGCMWNYTTNYSYCNEPKLFQVSRNFDITGEPLRIPYDKRCRYEFRSRVNLSRNCRGPIFSDFGAVVTYGVNEPLDETLTVVAIVIPVVLSFFMILSCYCFRRHSAILCPIIPDPSAIFKETMMSGNKELKTTMGGLYTPVPEPEEHCKVTLIPKNAILQQNY